MLLLKASNYKVETAFLEREMNLAHLVFVQWICQKVLGLMPFGVALSSLLRSVSQGLWPYKCGQGEAALTASIAHGADMDRKNSHFLLVRVSHAS